MQNEGLGSWLARRARLTRDAVAFVDAGAKTADGKAVTLTYDALHRRAMRLARGLFALGVLPGDRVAYLGPNHPAFLETCFATSMLGGVFVPLNYRLAAPELAYVLANSGTTVLVFASERAELAHAALEVTPLPQAIAVHGGPGALDYEALVARSPEMPFDENVALDDPAVIMYTSGTTGRPKGATLTHANLTWNAVNAMIDLDLTSRDVSLACAPLFHSATFGMLCLPTLVKGGTVVSLPSFELDPVFDAIAEHRVSFMFGVPTMFQSMARSPRWAAAELSSLRVLLCGGAPVPESLIRDYEVRGLTLLQGYGMTEVAPGALFLNHRAAHKVGSAGKASFFTDVRLVRPDFTDAKPGEPGEIVVKGPNVMKGYWDDPGATAASMNDGWFRSGDAGVVDDEGFFYIRDRLKDVIISGGENVYPAEIEAALHEHPAVHDCAVIGVPHEKWGEVGKAIVVLAPGARVTGSDLLASLAGKIGKYKIPASVEFAESLPRTGSGKLDKKALRAAHAMHARRS
jgi:fatty-acyl-CoA synthase